MTTEPRMIFHLVPAFGAQLLRTITRDQMIARALRTVDACSAFGTVAREAVRISLASSDEDLREGVGRLCELVAQLAAVPEDGAGPG